MAKSSDPLSAARSIIEETGVNLFLTGKAGTGKTTFLRRLSGATSKRHVILAPTGVAAINAGGSTIHSFFQLPFSPFIPGKGFGDEKKVLRISKQKLKLINTLDLIIIDEISMVRPDLLDAIDHTLRKLRNPLRPFGGIQLLLIGDLRQLAPVAQEDEWNLLKPYYDSPYFFESHALREAGFLMVELTKVFRQSDPVFLDILNRIRDNRADSSTLRALNSRAAIKVSAAEESSYVRLTTHNYRANAINADRLEHLRSPERVFNAVVEGDFPESAYPAEATLRLKKGARVIFIKNDPGPTKEYYNGLLGDIVEIRDNNEVVVRPIGDERKNDITVGFVEWERTRYTLDDNGEIKEEPEGVFRQIPLRLAWAITIHKSQGLTFDRAIVDAAHSFAPGQTYVALSRCRSLDGLVLDSPLPPHAIMTDPAVNSFIASQARMEGSEEELDSFRDSYFNQLLFELLDFRQIDTALDSVFRAATAALNAFPAYLDSLAGVRARFERDVKGVMYRLFNFLGTRLPERADPEVSAAIYAKIRGGASYFTPYLQELMQAIDNMPEDVDNKALKKRLATARTLLEDLLLTRLYLFRHFSSAQFDPKEYLRLKTEALLKFADGSGKPSARASASAGGRVAGARTKTSVAATAKPHATADVEHPRLYRRLTEWRRSKADGKPLYTVLHTSTIVDICRRLPTNRKAMLEVFGMGRVRYDSYGEELLSIVADYLSEQE